MLSVDKLKKIDPQLAECSDEELDELRSALYETAQLAFDVWWTRRGSKNPGTTFPPEEQETTL